MIPEVDAALRTLIERDALRGAAVDVVFDAPTREWAARQTAPAVDVYLYDVREDLRRRQRGLVNEYDDAHHVTGRRFPPRYFKLSYLVTAWTQRPEDEHRLLSDVLACFLENDALTGAVDGPLAALPAPVTIALPPPEDRSFADVWSALGGELKPSLDLVVSVPTGTERRPETGKPTQRPPRVDIGGRTGRPARETGPRRVLRRDPDPPP